ncbi:MAG: hypothetical protein E6J13_13435 [Chloroflexi bacterium]|nr:MAG: hypothetical protein E6J13_13435 [Chloroflexota bacterium]
MIAQVAERWRPRAFAAWALDAPLFPALACVAFAMVFSTLGAYRIAQTVRVEDLVFGPTRSAIVDTLLVAIGVERTAVLVYVLQRSFDALVVAAALTPIFLWLLGSSAIHAAARFRGARGRPYLPLLVLFAYATLVYQVPTSLAGIAFAGGPLGGLIDVVSLAVLIWFALVVHRGIERHYGVAGDAALGILLLGGLAFYLLPLILIGAALVGIVLAAAILEYF